MSRKIVLAALFTGTTLLASSTLLLKDMKKKPMMLSSLKEDKAYLFFYPYKSTPVILIKHEDEQNSSLQSLYAYSAISPERLSYPNREISLVDYYQNSLGDQEIRFCDTKESYQLFSGEYIPFEDENSSQKDPLLRINIQKGNKGQLLVEKIYEKEAYRSFFNSNRKTLEKTYGYLGRAKQENKNITVYPLEKYSTIVVKCNRIFLPEPIVETNTSMENNISGDLNSSDEETIFLLGE
jgi:hypothetical protein